MKRILWSVLLSLAMASMLGACGASDPDIESVDPSPHYGFDDPVVAIGNSLTAGYMNSGLIAQGQLQGYANLVARQFLQGIPGVTVPEVGGLPMAMSMPLVGSPGIGGSPGKSLLYVNSSGAITSDDLTVNPTTLLLASGLLQPYGNLGVPGALTIDVRTRLEAAAPDGIPLPANPFFDIVLRNSALPFNQGDPVSEVTENGTQLGQYLQIVESVRSTTALALLWIGNNDILGPATQGSGTVAPAAQFEATLAPVLDEIVRSQVPMVAIANIPSVTSAPYFTTVVGALMLAGLTPADLNTDETGVALVLLPAQALLFPNGSLDPEYLAPDGTKSLPANLTLTGPEAQNIGTAVAEYNAVIASQASARGWALVDIQAALDALSPLPSDTTINAAYPWIPGAEGQNESSAFSLDGIHPSEKGYAVVANEFIDSINANPQYAQILNALRGGAIPNVDPVAIRNLLGFSQAPRAGASALVLDPAAAVSVVARAVPGL